MNTHGMCGMYVCMYVCMYVYILWYVYMHVVCIYQERIRMGG